ncbi:GDSL-type esterase/lipase family protein [Nonomuraea soli]|uniref:Lysophospholipase L1-like esterase n=1 Tax=Nonomuraea soli TaxID=1032476 RepID=A0A7W0CJE7_9ACTN|nr:GDSL-type esterase/lipase family protein [Nonomuraea soli]MBA2892037.1 lysophospholipase L1-like esterase [Nonomuraea soli]
MLVDVVKLMIVGDSTSHGDRTWGDHLRQHLTASGVSVDVTSRTPDHLLVLPGVNGPVWQGDSPEQGEVDLRRFIANARLDNPRVRILIGRVLPTQRVAEDREFGERVAEFNVRLERAVNESRTKDSPVFTVPTDLEFVASDHTRDGTHPNANGQLRIAAAFADALARRFSIGTPYPRPFPEVIVIPKQHPHPATDAAAQPVARPAAEAAAQAAVQPAAQPAAEAVAQPVGQAVARPVAEAVAQPAAQLAAEAATEPIGRVDDRPEGKAPSRPPGVLSASIAASMAASMAASTAASAGSSAGASTGPSTGAPPVGRRAVSPGAVHDDQPSAVTGAARWPVAVLGALALAGVVAFLVRRRRATR